jgi:hypothetical protein
VHCQDYSKQHMRLVCTFHSLAVFIELEQQRTSSTNGKLYHLVSLRHNFLLLSSSNAPTPNWSSLRTYGTRCRQCERCVTSVRARTRKMRRQIAKHPTFNFELNKTEGREQQHKTNPHRHTVSKKSTRIGDGLRRATGTGTGAGTGTCRDAGSHSVVTVE